MQCTNAPTWELNRYRYLYSRGNSIAMDRRRQRRWGRRQRHTLNLSIGYTIGNKLDGSISPQNWAEAEEAASTSNANRSKNKWTSSQNGLTTWYNKTHTTTPDPGPWGIRNILAMQKQLYMLVCIRGIRRFECVMTKDDFPHTLYLAFMLH